MFGFKSSQDSSQRKETKITKNYHGLGVLDIRGLTQIDNINDFDDMDDDDEDLEAELLALTGENSKPRKPVKQLVNQQKLNKMVNESLRDIPSDEDVSSGEDDPSILAELEELQVDSTNSNKEIQINTEHKPNSMKEILLDRLKIYETAEQNAKINNDIPKARRMVRGITALKDMINKFDAGGLIKEEDIPPPVSVAVSKPYISEVPPAMPNDIFSEHSENSSVLRSTEVDTSLVAPNVSAKENIFDEPETKIKRRMNDTNSENEFAELRNTSLTQDIDVVKERQEQYKKAALEAKKSGDIQTALTYVKIVKQFDTIINKIKEGAILDVSSLPPPLEKTPISSRKSPIPPKKQDSIKLTSSLLETDNSIEIQQNTSQPMQESYIVPKTILEALEQRLKRYEESEEAAKKENNTSKVRRMGRIINQYKDAIKLHKAGKPIPIDELPTPPGFAPIPVNASSKSDLIPPREEPIVVSSEAVSEKRNQPVPLVSKNEKNRNSGQLTRNEKQLQIVLERQKLFKQAALKSKQDGNIELAKEYLKIAKGFDPMIEASHCGLPVDLTSLPLPPEEKKSLESDNNIVRLNNCIEGTDLDVYQKLISDLQQQMEMCIKTRDHFKAIGNIAEANRLDQLALRTKKDLKFVQLADMNNLRVPKFHYETKSFTIVHCNTDLTDNEVEIELVQGINYNVPNPKEIDTYVKLYFPYPTEVPQQFKSSIVYNTNNPHYDSTAKFNIQRNVRACQRIFKRQTLKCEIWSKGSNCCWFSGFFKSDSLIGTVNVKLQPLETQCIIHDAFDLMDGRKSVGGKLELKIKIRDPILKKQIENVEEKWLIIDS